MKKDRMITITKAMVEISAPETDRGAIFRKFYEKVKSQDISVYDIDGEYYVLMSQVYEAMN